MQSFAEDIRALVGGGRVPSHQRIGQELLAILDQDAAVRDAIEEAWRGRSFPASYARPLLLLAALRADALIEGPTHPLWPAIAEEPPRPETVTRAAVVAALSPRRAALYQRLRTRSVQTNETSRAVAWLWPAHLVARGPLTLVDVGASAGLNLVADQLPAPWTLPDGTPVPVSEVTAPVRIGFDATPLDVTDPESMAWLEACVWPGEPHRLERLRAAGAAMRAARLGPNPPRVMQALAQDIPAALPRTGLVLAYQTVFIDYVEPAARAAYVEGMRAWLAAAPSALWVELESGAQATPEWPAVIRATTRGPDSLETLVLARCAFHPSVIDPDPGAVARLRAIFAQK
jgi:hypothetical protein